MIYFPENAGYFPNPRTLYAEYQAVPLPNPCRKYHVSSDVRSASLIAGTVLPLLRGREVFHKVVKNQDSFEHQSDGASAGKFITIYMPASVAHKNETILVLADALALLKSKHGVTPHPRVPRARSYRHVFIEMPLDDEMFIWGGLVLDPTQ